MLHGHLRPARAVVLQNDGMEQHMADNFGKHSTLLHFEDFVTTSLCPGKHLSTLHELRKMFAT